jgi:EAL domain-containing protein (putative c-di-GMP-specific phosphodiesterase class I)
LENLDAAERFGSALTKLGSGLALDDFGTGFGSFTYLRKLPVCVLKIDSSFVRGVTTSPEDRAVVRSVVQIAQSFGRATIAEGVEDAGTLQALCDMGVTHAQGYYTGRPAPVLA